MREAHPGARRIAIDSFLYALVAVALTSLGGRDQLTVARLADRFGQTGDLLGLALLVSTVSAFAMALAGAAIAGYLPEPARQMLVAFSLGFSALELALPVRLKPIAEPTRSLGAIGGVLLLRQLLDAARFLIFALAVATSLAPMAGLGGALGGAIALALGWNMGATLERKLPLRMIRLVFAALLVPAAVFLALSARAAGLTG